MKVLSFATTVVIAMLFGCQGYREDEGVVEGCWEGDLLTHSPSDIANLDPYTCFNGSLTIWGPMIEAVSLPNLERVEGSLSIEDCAVTSLDFPGLVSVTGRLTVKQNDNLTGLTGFASLQSVGDLYIESNDEFQTTDWFPSLALIENTLSISGNLSLSSISGFNVLTAVGKSLLISENESLLEVKAFRKLTTVGGELLFASNDKLRRIEGFNELTRIDSRLSISDNESLEIIDGFENLLSVGENISIHASDSLVNTEWLARLTEVGGNIMITSSGMLSLASLNDNIVVKGGWYIVDNGSLPYCDLCDLVDQLAHEPSTFNVRGSQVDSCQRDNTLFCE